MLAARSSGLLDDRNAAAFAVSINSADMSEGGPRDMIPGFRVFLDHDGAVSRLYGVLRQGKSGSTGYMPAAFLLDPLLRVIAAAPLARLPDLIERLRRLPPAPTYMGMEAPAPVLVLPRILEPELCQRLGRPL